jgi:ferric-dicitrate binding protein FerR (iron transport regulator)
VELLRGEMEASAPAQAGPFAAFTAHAELRLAAGSARLQAASGFSRLEVVDGQASFTRRRDGRSVRVPPDHYAVAGADIELAALPVPRGGPAAGGAAVVAHVRQVQGQAFTFTKSPADRIPLRAGQALLETQSLLTEGSRSSVAVEYPDRTRLELGGDSVLRRLSDEKDRLRKLVVLERGAIVADVLKQPAGKPMILRTAQAEATVLGTRFLLAAEAESTRLAVEEGAVAFVRQSDRQAVTVRSGFSSTAAPGRSLEPVPVPGGARYLELDLAAGAADGDGDWAVEGRTIRQRRVSRLAEGGGSTLLFRTEAAESLVIEATAEVDQVTPDTSAERGTWGFGLEAMFRNRSVALGSIQGPEGASVFEFAGLSAIPFEHGREGAYRIKLAVDRRREGQALLRGKIWQGDREPDGWMIEGQADLEGPLAQVGLRTVRAACSFSSFKVRLVREESR